jgi:2-phospho-L-lactate guanylyltransferase
VHLTWAILPVKPFGEAKSRLSSVLSGAQRAELARQLMLGTLASLQGAPGVDRVLVVSQDADALRLAAERGVEAHVETGAGLNAALSQARAVAMAGGAERMLVLASDLPCVSSQEIEAMLREDAPVVIAPDRRRHGTNALLLSPPDAIDFAFGEGSLARHIELARAAGLEPPQVSLAGLEFDIDLPEDWRDLQSMLPGLDLPDAVRLSAGA